MKRKTSLVLLMLISVQLTFSQQLENIGLESLKALIENKDVRGLESLCDSIAGKKLSPAFTPEELIDLSRTLYLENRKEDAIAYAHAASLIFPESSDCQLNIGTLMSWMGQNDIAATYFSNALRLDPLNIEAEYQLSRIEGIKLDKEAETKAILTDGKMLGSNQGLYPDEKCPGIIPELFAPGIISTSGNLEFGCSFSPDMREFYFTRRAENSFRNIIMVSYRTQDGWSMPDTAWFSNGFSDFEPHHSKNGKRIYFGSVRPVEKGRRPVAGIWYIEKEGNHWSGPMFLVTGMFASESSDSTLYLSNVSGNPDEGISYFNPYTGDKPEIMGGSINNPVAGHHPCIAEDASYIIFDSHREGYKGGESDLYVSFRNESGEFPEAHNLGGNVNGAGAEFGACITPDGKYILFTKHRDIYWVSSEIIN